MINNVKLLVAINIGIIFLISIFGRDLQSILFGVLNKNHFGLLIAALFIVGFIVVSRSSYSKIYKKNTFFIRVIICTSLMLISQNFIMRPEEKLHLLLFSFLGFFCSFFPRVSVAFVIVLGVSFGDEVLQYFLPTRYFGWDDVILNSYASIAAILIFRFRKLKY